jgi:hypothetical protein
VRGFWRVWCPICRRHVQTRIPSPAPLGADDPTTPTAISEYFGHMKQHGVKRK